MTARAPKLNWIAISRNEREVIYKDRYFFAGRCNPKHNWKIIEYGMDGKFIQVVFQGSSTRDLTASLIHSLDTESQQ